MPSSYGLRPADTNSIMLAAELLRQGGLVAFPTETVYGLGAAACNPEAVARIFGVKQRPTFDPLIVHLAEATVVQEFAEVSPTAEKLMQAFWPGPLTVVLPKTKTIPDIVTAGLPNVALRVPAHPVALFLLRAANMPIAAPSANPFGRLSPTKAEHVMKYLGDKIDLVLDGGACERGLESTIVRLKDGQLEILRPGPVTPQQLEQVTGCPVVMPTGDKITAPGMLKSHYAPRTPLRIVDKITAGDVDPHKVALFFKQPTFDISNFAATRLLSAGGDLIVAAANLFSALHELDSMAAQEILAESVPETGLGIAIMNRLRKAAAK